MSTLGCGSERCEECLLRYNNSSFAKLYVKPDRNPQMKIGISLLILLVAIIALVAEAILYFFFGIGAAFSGKISNIGGIAFFFVSAMIMTLTLGVSAPVCAFVETFSKKENIGYKILLWIQGLLFLFLIGVNQIRNHFDAGSEKQNMAQSALGPMKIAPGPFGFSKGMSKSEIEKIIHLKADENHPNRYLTAVVPLPHESFTSYQLTIDPTLGLCSIAAMGEPIVTNSQGDLVKFKYNKLKSALIEKYGAISDDLDKLSQGSFFKSPESWMIALNKGERQLMAWWESNGDRQLGNDLLRVGLSAQAQSIYSGSVLLYYEFLNNDECEKNVEKLISKAL
jgi:hypothetical protein